MNDKKYFIEFDVTDIDIEIDGCRVGSFSAVSQIDTDCMLEFWKYWENENISEFVDIDIDEDNTDEGRCVIHLHTNELTFTNIVKK